jgi:hypothetical protein
MAEENKKQYNSGKDVKTLRTYTSDMADAIRTNETSVIKIALAEKEKREQEMMYQKAEGTKSSKIFWVVGGVILIIAAIVVSYILIQKKKEGGNQTPIANKIDTFIMYDAHSYIDVSNTVNVSDLLAKIKEKEGEETGLIKALFLTKKVGENFELITANNFLSILKTGAPGALTRSLADKYLFGKYRDPNRANEKGKDAIFLIFQVSDYSQAYASMLEWEKGMLEDLFPLFGINIPGGDKTFFERPWKDVIINNRDARVLYGDAGEGLLYYVFLNKNNFIITNNIDALREVMTRLMVKNSTPL